MIRKTKIEKRLQKKRNPVLVETLIKLKKTNPEIAKLLAKPVKKMLEINLDGLSDKVKEGEKILFPGKVLGHGSLDKKIEMVVFSISDVAKEKLKKAGTSVKMINEADKLNDFKILK